MSLQLIPGPDGGGGDGVGEGHQLLLPLPSQTPSCAQLSLDARAASSSGQSLHHSALQRKYRIRQSDFFLSYSSIPLLVKL